MKKKELKNEELEKVTGGAQEPENTNVVMGTSQMVATTGLVDLGSVDGDGLLPLGSTGNNEHGMFIIGSTGSNGDGLAPLPRNSVGDKKANLNGTIVIE